MGRWPLFTSTFPLLGSFKATIPSDSIYLRDYHRGHRISYARRRILDSSSKIWRHAVSGARWGLECPEQIYVYVYIYIYICMYTHTIYIYIYIYIYRERYIYTYVCVYIYIYIYILGFLDFGGFHPFEIWIPDSRNRLLSFHVTSISFNTNFYNSI